MAGHSKWANIKRRKARQDRRRARIFNKLIREITVAAREGGGDPDFNPRLRLAVETARSENMPSDNIESAILRGTGELEGVDYEEATYEGYGPGGVALFIEATTDNANRTVAEVRHLLESFGGNLGTDGSVAWQFDRKGVIAVDGERYHEDAVIRGAIEAGVEDVHRADGRFLLTTAVEDFHEVQEHLRGAGIEFDDASLSRLPTTEVPVEGREAERLLELLDALEDSDDVQNVYANLDVSDEVMAELEAVG